MSIIRSPDFSGSNNGKPFDDVVRVGGGNVAEVLEFEHPITQMEMLHGDVIDGIKITYRLKDGSSKAVTHGTDQIEKSASMKYDKITLNSNEVIYAVTGRAGENSAHSAKLVNQLSLVIFDTSTGGVRNAGPFGNRNGKNAGDVFNVSGTLVALGGRADDGEKSMGLKDICCYTKLPVH